MLNDSEMVGDIVWAPDNISGIHWPGEVLDPCNMPLGRSIPKDAISKLTSDQIKASIPSLRQEWDVNEELSENKRVLVIFLPLENGQWKVCARLTRYPVSLVS